MELIFNSGVAGYMVGSRTILLGVLVLFVSVTSLDGQVKKEGPPAKKTVAQPGKPEAGTAKTDLKADQAAQPGPAEKNEGKAEAAPAKKELGNPATPAKARFWAGEILAAEVSLAPIVIKNIKPHDPLPAPKPVEPAKPKPPGKGPATPPPPPPPPSGKDRGYAVVYVKLDSGRSLSVYDYFLDDGASYRCFAVSEGDEPFDLDNWQILKTDPGKVYRMLFIPELSDVASDQIKFDMKFRLVNEVQKPVMVKFKNRQLDKLIPAAEIPPYGILGIEY